LQRSHGTKGGKGEGGRNPSSLFSHHSPLRKERKDTASFLDPVRRKKKGKGRREKSLNNRLENLSIVTHNQLLHTARRKGGKGGEGGEDG